MTYQRRASYFQVSFAEQLTTSIAHMLLLFTYECNDNPRMESTAKNMALKECRVCSAIATTEGIVVPYGQPRERNSQMSIGAFHRERGFSNTGLRFPSVTIPKRSDRRAGRCNLWLVSSHTWSVISLASPSLIGWILHFAAFTWTRIYHFTSGRDITGVNPCWSVQGADRK